MSDNALLLAAVGVDVLDVAGRIIANPKRNAVAASAAEVLALAHAAEKFWAVAIEAEVLVRAYALPITGNDHSDALRDDAIQLQLVRVTQLMTEIRGTEEEKTDGNSSS